MTESVPLPRAERGMTRPVAPPRPKIDTPVRQSAEAGGHAATASQIAWLKRGLDQPGGKLPLFDANGKKVDTRTIRRCLEAGWAEPWFANPVKPDWLVCKLTARGRALVSRAPRPRSAGRPGASAKAPAEPAATLLPLR